jgi:hypothetical protein
VRRHRRLPVAAAAVAVAASISLAGCGAGDDDTAASSTSTTATVTDPGIGDDTVPTLPPTVPDGVDADLLPDPSPPLPNNFGADPFAIGALATLGNVQIIVDGVGQRDGTFTVDLRLRNASLDDLGINVDSFLLYPVSGVGRTPRSADGSTFDGSIPADTWSEGRLEFDLPDDERPIVLVFDSAAYGDRVFSGAVVVGE